MRKYRIFIPAVLWLFVLFTFKSIAQQEETKESGVGNPYRIPYVSEHISVDGYLNESIWGSAVKVEANIEVNPGENIPAPVQTEALLMYDHDNIYVGFNAYDPDPSRIQAHFSDRDNIWDDDWILILFDTFNDQRRTYDFVCNPLGIQGDQIETPMGGGGSWDAIWESAGRITDEGYVVEMVIPFRTMSFPRTEGEQIWGVDVVRSYPRDVRHHIGAFVRDRNNNCYMCQAIKLVGFAGASPGRNVEFDPTTTALFSQEREEGTSGSFIDREKKSDFGLTARWGFTPNLTLSTTLNPDFSNIEADVLQLDINNKFAIYYPEKRPFFLEGADFFSTQHTIVHTRTLADPDWGVKITGKEGPHAIGFFVVQDQLTNFLFPGAEGSRSGSMDQKSIGSAFRYRSDIFKSSNIGFVLTDRESENYHNRVGGIDGNLKFTQKDQFQFMVLRTNT
ncbi:carbohydrate binding family 9 domain-containing protein, partial [bacterium]|nr:carbohydrate binding family 9 domain-containing protein [bacterium]